MLDESDVAGQTFTMSGNGTFNLTGVANFTSNLATSHVTMTGPNANLIIGTNGSIISNVTTNTTNGYNSIGIAPGDNISITLNGNGSFISNKEVSLTDFGGNVGASNVTLNVTGSTAAFTANDLWVGKGSSTDDATDAFDAVVNQTGGTVTLTGSSAGTGAGSLQLGDSIGLIYGESTAIYSLSGGSLLVNNIAGANSGLAGVLDFDFNGGTLVAEGNSTNFITIQIACHAAWAMGGSCEPSWREWLCPLTSRIGTFGI